MKKEMFVTILLFVIIIFLLVIFYLNQSTDLSVSVITISLIGICSIIILIILINSSKQEQDSQEILPTTRINIKTTENQKIDNEEYQPDNLKTDFMDISRGH